MKRKFALYSVVVLLAVGILSAFFFGAHEGRQEVNYRINHYKIGQHDLYIADAYTRFKYTSVGVGGKSGLIQAYYPGGAPVQGGAQELWRQGEWHKNVRILFDDLTIYPSFNFEKVLEGKIHLYKTSKIVGNQYGLIYQTQPDNSEITWPNELWIEKENSDVVSFVSCRKKYDEGILPQCSHHFHDDMFSYKVSYDKRLLPEWKLIRTNVLALMNSFKSEASAREFLAAQISKAQPSQMEKSHDDARRN